MFKENYRRTEPLFKLCTVLSSINSNVDIDIHEHLEHAHYKQVYVHSAHQKMPCVLC